jgi:hypothetical protein
VVTNLFGIGGVGERGEMLRGQLWSEHSGSQQYQQQGTNETGGEDEASQHVHLEVV